MSTLIRPSFHALTLTMLACACLVVAQTLNTVLSVSLLPSVTSVSPPPERSAPPGAPSVPLSVELLARYMGLPLADGPKPTTDLSDDTQPTLLALKLLGTMTSAAPDMSLASVYEDSARRTRTVWVGSSLLGAEVLAIERTRVVLWNGGRMEFLEAHALQGTPGGITPPPSPSAPAGPPTGFGATIRQTGPEAYTIQRHDVENTLANLAQIATQARVVPAFSGGISRGFKLFGVKQDSFYSRLGMKNGDILQRVNGFALDSPTRALEAYNHLRDASRIEIEVERDGQPLRKSYTVED